MSADSTLSARVARVRAVLARLVGDGVAPGMVAVLAQAGEVEVAAVGQQAFERDGATVPMATDTICRLGSSSKPIVAAALMTLIDDGTVGLDDAVEDLVPELADMRVLVDPAGPLIDTVPAARPITIRDVLAGTLGTGMVPAEPGTVPIADALDALRPVPLDEWIGQLGALPLVHQPGERWLYDTAANVTGVLIQRATGRSFGDALRARVTGPLGMDDTGFWVPEGDRSRLAAAYAQHDDADGRPVAEPTDRWLRPPVFESGGGGLVSTADDSLRFSDALRTDGALLSPASVALMTSDQLTAAQKAVSGFWPGYFDEIGWGFGMSVRTRSGPGQASVGTYGWPGFYGTAWYHDPTLDLTTIVMMQRAHAGDQRLPMWVDLWAAVY